MAEYVVVDKEQLESDLTAVANVIRTKSGNGSTLTFPNGFVDAANSITPRTYSDVLNESIANRTITEFTDETMTEIPHGFFSGCLNLNSINIPNATSIGMGAFSFVLNVQEVNLPNVRYLNPYAFLGCVLPCSDLAFGGTPSYSGDILCFPLLTEIADFAFSGTNAEYIAFLSDTAVVRVGAFSICSLTCVEFIGSATIEKYAFQTCRSLVELYIMNGGSIDELAFAHCEGLCFFYFDGAFVSLASANAVLGTPFEYGLGELYVPEALIEQYKNDPAWSIIINDLGNTIYAI